VNSDKQGGRYEWLNMPFQKIIPVTAVLYLASRYQMINISGN
jgi:hypothetical protein